MQELDYEEFAKALTKLAERLPRNLTSTLIEAYFDSFKKYTFSTVRTVLEHWPKHPAHKKFPLESELLEVIKRNSTKEYAEQSELRHNIMRQREELQLELYRLALNYIANNIEKLRNGNIIKEAIKLDGKIADIINKDYTDYQTNLTNDQLQEQENIINSKLSELYIVEKNL